MDVLSSKSYKQYSRISRYNSFPTYYHSIDDKYVYGITSWLSTDTPYIIYTVKQGDTWDSIALYRYGNSTYYWILTDFNRIQDCLQQPVEGQSIKIPTFSSLQFVESLR